MAEIDLSDIAAQFPRSIAQEAELRLRDRDASDRERLMAYGARLVLGGGSTMLSPADIAHDSGLTETTLYRIYPGNLIESIEQDGGTSLKDTYITPRHQALTEAAVRLAVDDQFNFNDAIARWSRVYAAIANPSAIFSIGHSLPQLGNDLAGEHANIITRSVNLFGLRDNTRVDARFGKMVMHSTAGTELFDASGLGLANEGIIHTYLKSLSGTNPESADRDSAPGDALAARIRAMREAAGLTQSQFGDLYGVSRFTINRVENGRVKSGRVLSALAAKLEQSTTDPA